MILYFDEFEFELERLELRRGGKTLTVDLTVLRVLAVLVTNAGRLVTKQEIIEHVWLMSLLDAALERSMIVAELDSRTEFKFAHEFWRIAFYEVLTPAERRALHRSVATALEHQLASGIPVASADLAFPIMRGCRRAIFKRRLVTAAPPPMTASNGPPTAMRSVICATRTKRSASWSGRVQPCG